MTQQAEESQQKIISRIKQALSRTDHGFSLFFALVNLPETRKKIAAILIQQLKRPVIEITVNPAELEGTTLDAWLLPQLKSTPKDSIVFLYQLNEVLPAEKKALRHYLQQLNWRRFSLAAMQRPLLIWLPIYAIEQLAEYAPDFYDWYSNVYEFNSSTEDKEKIKTYFRTEFDSSEVHPAERMSHREKQKWLRTLSVLLDENRSRNKYRAKLLNDLGRLHKAIGNLENADEYYKEALGIQQEIGDKSGEGNSLNNISQIFMARGDYETALKYLEQSLVIQQEIGDIAGLCATLFNIGHNHAQNKAMDEATKTWVRVYKLAKPRRLAEALQALAEQAPQLGLPEGLEGWEALSKRMDKQ